MDKNQLLRHVEALKGKSVKDIDRTDRLANLANKGSTGQVIEESFFGYAPNSRSSADFEEENVELKVTPYKKNQNGTVSAKERLVLNIINYEKEYRLSFEESSFWTKNQILLLLFYLHIDGVPRAEQVIEETMLYEYPDEDLKIIKNDYRTIQDNIKAGKAHEISEGDTLYLGACTKGANRKSMRSQPFSDTPAMQRAYSLKQSYMTQLLRKYVFGDEKDEKIVTDINELESKSLESIIRDKISRYIGEPRESLKKTFDVRLNAKNLNEVLVARMLGINGKVSRTEEFKKANIVPKTIRLNTNGTITESMSFSPFRFEELYKEDEWETSSLRDYFESTRFMFVIFQDKGDDYIFKGVKFWSMPPEDLDDHMKEVWEKTRHLVREGRLVKEIHSNRKRTFFPKKNDNPVGHVRPHGRNAEDTYSLPVPDQKTGMRSFTKHSFWLNNDYVLKQIT